ncbi:hypothetical protein CERSUDRAFT_118718 [Gelatoporia subvermispora B]|uniref:Uncharacterized protein n=1 Tax=Ceriporiopsis subvermispora (strain B) TaxID=914234 RepID=M2QJQ6_CERS8|nr:hypothetical protein CERSUDRAFT_118718 [Gelatoporia subvermispora B]
MSSNNTSTGSSAGGSAGNAIKGAWQTFAGAGDSIRGNAMDFVDTLTGSGGKHAETDVGTRETKEGVARMKGVNPGNAASGVVGQESVGTQPTTTAAPPLPERRRDATGAAPAAAPTGNTGRLDNTTTATAGNSSGPGI